MVRIEMIKIELSFIVLFELVKFKESLILSSAPRSKIFVTTATRKPNDHIIKERGNQLNISEG